MEKLHFVKLFNDSLRCSELIVGDIKQDVENVLLTGC